MSVAEDDVNRVAQLVRNGLEELGSQIDGPLALARCIETVNGDLAAGLDHEAEAFGELAKTADMKEGTAAFLGKRPPVFKGN